MQCIAVLTSGGDAPGMNAAIRAVVRSALARGLEVLGVRHGYQGLITGEFIKLGARDVGGIIERGGTVLGTSRCEAFKADAGQLAAVQHLEARDISGLIVIGGNGSQAGACALSRRGIATVGIASTIDNDLAGSDTTLGATTALGVALEALDRLRVTASAHGRVFLVEVMGRECGYLALMAGIAGGAEAIVIPEVTTDPESVAEQVRQAYARGKSHAIVIVSEGAACSLEVLAQHFSHHAERLGFELRVTRLGHIQRGGAPAVFDRLSGTQLGAAAVDYLHAGRHGVLLGLVNGALCATPFGDLRHLKKRIDPHWVKLAHELAQ
ncbi:MAG TPA: ATP-dependent 6-phosphofructokinase [Steroidobacteraceae bacterium]|nr:ATP-dependent 6-phosphofructokinase [Steroidobacteraceae bacterium]